MSGVGFDCLPSEPPADDHPFWRIVERPNVIVTPHVAWASAEVAGASGVVAAVGGCGARGADTWIPRAGP